MAFNLSRNSRVFVTTNLNTATGAVASTNFTTLNTWEIQVLDGFSFSQSTNAQTVTINEAGNTPTRGQRSFNTALNPVEISFSTYIRPYSNADTASVTAEERVLWNALLGSVGVEGTSQNGSLVASTTLGGTPAATVIRQDTTATASTITISGSGMNTLTVGATYNITGLTGSNARYANIPVKVVSSTATLFVGTLVMAPPASLGTTLANVTAVAGVKFTQSAWQEAAAGAGTYAKFSSAFSNKNQLQALGLIFLVDNTWYSVDNCAVDSAQIDFGLDAIATVAWSLKGTKLNTVDMSGVTGTNLSNANPIFGTGGSGGLQGTATGKNVNAGYITNKLSTIALTTGINGVGGSASQNSTGLGAGTAYSVVLTGGSVTIANNINYVTPNNIGVVNKPIGYFTGTRAISGSVNAYLKTASLETADLLKNLLAASTVTEPKFAMTVAIGGSSNGVRMELEMPATTLQLPSVDVQDVVSTTINFTAQSAQTESNATTSTFDIEQNNEVFGRYYSNV